MYFVRPLNGVVLSILTAQIWVTASAQPVTSVSAPPPTAEISTSTHILGRDDEVTIWIADVPDLSANGGRMFTVSPSGVVHLPLVGEIQAAGLTASELEALIAKSVKRFIRVPQVNVTVTQIRSQPVSVLGAVNTPGIQQLRGRKTLIEMLSMAGGLRPDAGSTATITRLKSQGELPLPKVAADSTGRYWVAEVNLESVMAGASPENNATILPHDVITVQRVKVIYVVGAVTRAGAFPLNEKENLSVLKAISMAGGVTNTAATGDARVIRGKDDPAKRQELAVNLKNILSGRNSDVPMVPDDVLFVPDSRAKKIANRTLEAALSTVGGMLVFRSSTR